MNKKLNWIAWFSVLTVGVISSLKLIHEPDLWWQIRTGQWILKEHHVPKVDVFSYTFLNEPWMNVKWLAEVLMATVNNIFGPEWLVLLQVFCISLILHFCYKLAKVLRLKTNKQVGNFPRIGIMLACLLLLFTINYRMNSRPEMFSHLMLIVFLYYLFKYSNTKSNWLLILIPLQILWTNIHEAYGMGIVLILIFLFANWIESFLFKKEKPLKFSAIAVVAVLSSAVNPNGFKMIFHPFNIFGQLSKNKFTTELLGFDDSRFWQYQSFILLIVFAFCVYILFRKKEDGSNIFKTAIAKFGLPYILIVVAFFYLSLTAFRNIPFFMIVCTPLLANYLDETFNGENPKKYFGLIASCMLFYGLIASNVLYQNLLPREQFGIGVNTSKAPIGAAQFIKTNNIAGKGFVDYFSSSYFLYALQPEFQSYIDLRDLDVFTSDFFKNTLKVYQEPNAELANGLSLWDYYKEYDKFNYIVLLNNPNFGNLNRHLVHQDEEFVLVYADHLNSVYLRQGNENLDLIETFAYPTNTDDVFKPQGHFETTKSAKLVSKVLWPFNKLSNEEDFLVLRSYYYNYLDLPVPVLKHE